MHTRRKQIIWYRMHIKMQSEMHPSLSVYFVFPYHTHNLHTYKRVGPYVTYLKSRELQQKAGEKKSIINILWWTWEHSDWIRCISFFSLFLIVASLLFFHFLQAVFLLLLPPTYYYYNFTIFIYTTIPPAAI